MFSDDDMARVVTNVSERIFNITNWRGVNEAPEGEARLKLGEAAEMRNFCVTSGGALKKRPGSMNVAGLLSAYTAKVKEGTRELLFTDTGAGSRYEMYPRMLANDMGKTETTGEAAEVTVENAKEYEGYFYERDGECYAFTECAVTPGKGTESIVGGMATPGTLTQIGSGVEKWTKGGGSVFTGDTSVKLYDGAAIVSGEVELRGSLHTRGAPAGENVGWATQNAGGFFMRNRTLYRYYGARIDSYTGKRAWNKYACNVITTDNRYYTEGDWSTILDSTSSSGTYGGYPSYSFNKSTGMFSETGSFVNIKSGQSGTLYLANKNMLTKTVLMAVTTSSSRVVMSRKYSQGPFGTVETTYSRGSYIGSVSSAGTMPEEDDGYTYVTTITHENTQYIVMKKGSSYYCYTPDADAGVTEYERRYSFHAYPLTVTANQYDWYFNRTYCEANETADTVVRGVWSGFVGGREVLCAACGGTLWELIVHNGVWEKISAGEMDTSGDVHMFGFDEKLYILNGSKYLVWDGQRLAEVEGYRPLVSVAVEPSGGGTLLENINRLTAGRRCWFSPDGSTGTFKLPESDLASVDWVRSVADGWDIAGVSYDLNRGTVTFAVPPAKGINTVEVAYSAKEDFRDQVRAMRFAEIYNGAQDSRVFLYGDGSNKAFYSGLDYNGKPRADYFPDLYEVAVGDANTPLTAMIRHYNKLMAFKLDSAWSIGYDTITLIDGTVTAGFYVTPVNRAIGNCAFGQAQLVQNRPRTLDGRSVIEWRSTSSSGITGDQRNAERVSQRVDSSIRTFDLSRARTFYDKFSHEYYVIGEDGTAIVQNLDVDAWYVYTGLEVTCMINYRDELYYGTKDGYLRHFSDRYFSDNGEAIDAYWESGAMSFSEDFRRKYSAMVWIGIKPEDNGYLEVTAQTDRKSDFAVYDVQGASALEVPEMERIKLKAKKFTYYKLILRNNSGNKTATVVSADVRVRGTGYVR